MINDDPLLPVSISKSRKKRTGNVPQKLLMECQALIAFACYDSPAISGGGASMTEQAISNLMLSLCFGSSEDANHDIMCFADQFLLGLNKFEGLFHQSVVEAQPLSATSADNDSASPAVNQMLLTMHPILHQLGKKVNVFVGRGSLEKTLLSSKSVGNIGSRVTGRILCRLARDVLCKFKKLQALVTASKSPYKDGNFPSGTNWDDYILWCLTAMHDHEGGGSTARGLSSDAMSPPGDDDEEDSTHHGSNTDIAAGDDSPMVEDNASANQACPATSNKSSYVFKGFLSWCLWGHIPIDNGNSNNFKSLLFTDMKAGTKLEKGSASRKSLKLATAAAAAAVPDGQLLNGVVVDNRRGDNKRHKVNGEISMVLRS